MENNLNGKCAIVCGSTDGIGKAIATLMAERGCKIILVSRNQEKLELTRNELNESDQHSTVCADFNRGCTTKFNTSNWGLLNCSNEY